VTPCRFWYTSEYYKTIDAGGAPVSFQMPMIRCAACAAREDGGTCCWTSCRHRITGLLAEVATWTWFPDCFGFVTTGSGDE
jgi:hypothetical protein